jgi:DNA repair ATPase RecN
MKPKNLCDGIKLDCPQWYAAKVRIENADFKAQNPKLADKFCVKELAGFPGDAIGWKEECEEIATHLNNAVHKISDLQNENGELKKQLANATKALVSTRDNLNDICEVLSKRESLDISKRIISLKECRRHGAKPQGLSNEPSLPLP